MWTAGGTQVTTSDIVYPIEIVWEVRNFICRASMCYAECVEVDGGFRLRGTSVEREHMTKKADELNRAFVKWSVGGKRRSKFSVPRALAKAHERHADYLAEKFHSVAFKSFEPDDWWDSRGRSETPLSAGFGVNRGSVLTDRPQAPNSFEGGSGPGAGFSGGLRRNFDYRAK